MERDREREEGGGGRGSDSPPPMIRHVLAPSRTRSEDMHGEHPPALDAATVFSRTAGAPMRPAIRCAQMRRADEGGSARR